MQAFDGIRVIEFAQVIAGPLASELLAFLGADVIKVEAPEGDQARRILDTGPRAGTDMSPLYEGLNLNKRSLAIDLKLPGAAEVVRRLVSGADVVIENFRPGVMDRLGFGFDALSAIRPGLIYCSVSGFGQTSPRRGAPAYDGAIQAASGMMTVTGNADAGPLRVGYAVIDVSTGMTGAFAIASALFRRAMTGEGQYIDVSMLDTAMFLQSPLITQWLVSDVAPAQIGNKSLTLQPTADTFPTGEGFLQVSAITPPQIRGFLTAVGLSGLLADPCMATVESQLASSGAIRDRLVAALSAKSAVEWEPLLAAAGVPVARVLTVPQAIVDPELAARNIVADAGRGQAAVLPGFVMNADGPAARTASQLVGENTDAILAELGYSPAEIEQLRADGVVSSAE